MYVLGLLLWNLFRFTNFSVAVDPNVNKWLCLESMTLVAPRITWSNSPSLLFPLLHTASDQKLEVRRPGNEARWSRSFGSLACTHAFIPAQLASMAMVAISVGVLELTSPSLLHYSLVEKNLESLALDNTSPCVHLFSSPSLSFCPFSHFTHLQLGRPPTEMES